METIWDDVKMESRREGMETIWDDVNVECWTRLNWMGV